VADNEKWVGSEPHRRFLEHSLPDAFAVPDASLVWGPPNAPSSWKHEGRLITLERPMVTTWMPAVEAAEWTALGLLHETLHARFSPELGLFDERHANLLDPVIRGVAHLLFQRLEDGRIAVQGLAEDPALAGPLEKHAKATAEQIAQLAKQRGCGNTLTPTSDRGQLLFAFESYCEAPHIPLTLHPRVEGRLAKFRDAIDASRNGTSEDCDQLCVRLAKPVIALGFEG
jgi:hypothetical protein